MEQGRTSRSNLWEDYIEGIPKEYGEIGRTLWIINVADGDPADRMPIQETHKYEGHNNTRPEDLSQLALQQGSQGRAYLNHI